MLGLLLLIAMSIGIISNVLFPINLKITAIIMAGCLLGWCLRPWYLRFTSHLVYRHVTWFLTASVTLMILIQIVVLIATPATIFHDPFRVLVQAEQLSRGHLNWHELVYFWRFPNNVSLTVILAGWLKVTHLFHLSTTVSVHGLSLLMLDGFIVTILAAVRRVSQKDAGVILAAIFFLISPFAYTYYLQAFYSDLPTLISLALTFYVIIGWTHFTVTRKWVMGIILMLSVILGEVVKPNLIVLGVAVTMVVIWLALRNRQQYRRLRVPLVTILLGFVLAVPTNVALKNVSHFHNNSTYQFPTTHWIWMSYNPHYDGRYNLSDVKTIAAIPGKENKQAYLQKQLRQRLTHLGILGVVGRWIQKASVLMNVAPMQRAYTGGFIQTPRWYQRLQQPLTLFGQLVMRIGFVLLYTETLIRCWRLWRQGGQVPTADPRITLLILTSLGYIAFHTLLWETESRYGQVLVPLLGLLCSIPSLNQAAMVTTRIYRRWQIGLAGLTGLVFAGGIFIKVPRVKPAPTVVASQLSQLSLQFDAKKTNVQPLASLAQNVTLNHQFRTVRVSLAPGANFTGWLYNRDTGYSYHMNRTPQALKLNHTLPAGHYQLELTNRLRRSQSILITKTIAYQIAPHPLRLNGHWHKYQSLVYVFER